MNIKQQNRQLGAHDVSLVTLSNPNGVEVELLNWGATLLDVRTPNKNGVVESVTLAYADLEMYLDNPSYFGCTIGRVAGRIANSQFHLAGEDYAVSANSGAHQLHGGAGGMSQQVWQIIKLIEQEGSVGVRMEYTSPAGHNGYPGTLNVAVEYHLTNDNTLSISYSGNTDVATLFNPTNHTYFNLSGNTARSIKEQVLQVAASHVCAMNDELLVSGEEWNVSNTAFDFRDAQALSQILNSTDPRVVSARGIDHYFILDSDPSRPDAAQIILFDPISGRRMSVSTDQPCVVLYAHNYASGEQLRHGVVGQAYDSLCIETQKLPHIWAQNGDHPAALYPEQTYQQITSFKFDVVA